MFVYQFEYDPWYLHRLDIFNCIHSVGLLMREYALIK